MRFTIVVFSGAAGVVFMSSAAFAGKGLSLGLLNDVVLVFCFFFILAFTTLGAFPLFSATTGFSMLLFSIVVYEIINTANATVTGIATILVFKGLSFLTR